MEFPCPSQKDTEATLPDTRTAATGRGAYSALRERKPGTHWPGCSRDMRQRYVRHQGARAAEGNRTRLRQI